MGDFLQTLSPGAYMGGVDLQDSYLHWLVAPVRRRFLGARRPLPGVLGVYLLLPFGLGPVKMEGGTSHVFTNKNGRTEATSVEMQRGFLAIFEKELSTFSRRRMGEWRLPS